MGELRVVRSHVDDDAIVVRDGDGDVLVQLSTWLHPAQRLVLERWIGALLEAPPTVPMVMHLRTGQVLARTAAFADARLAELMDKPALSTAEHLEAVELVCR